MEILALLPGASALDVVHAHGDRVVAGVDHGAVARVGEAAVRLAPRTVPPLELSAHLGSGGGEAEVTQGHEGGGLEGLQRRARGVSRKRSLFTRLV